MENQTPRIGPDADQLQEQRPVAVKIPYSTNPRAETIINICALVILIFGLLSGVIMIIGSISSGSGGAMALTTIIGIGVIIFALIQWAFLKVLCNMSRNLFNIYDFIRKMD